MKGWPQTGPDGCSGAFGGKQEVEEAEEEAETSRSGSSHNLSLQILLTRRVRRGWRAGGGQGV